MTLIGRLLRKSKRPISVVYLLKSNVLNLPWVHPHQSKESGFPEETAQFTGKKILFFSGEEDQFTPTR